MPPLQLREAVILIMERLIALAPYGLVFLMAGAVATAGELRLALYNVPSLVVLLAWVMRRTSISIRSSCVVSSPA